MQKSSKKYNYTEEDIKQLDPIEHIRKRPGMYIGKLGDGSTQDDGIYILLKEAVDNAVDEFLMGYGNKVEIKIDDNNNVQVRDYGRGIPLGKVKEVASEINTGAKYGSNAFKKTVGLNGVGLKAVNALSEKFIITSYRDKEYKKIVFSRGRFVSETNGTTEEPDGVLLQFLPDFEVFEDFSYEVDFVEQLIKNYVYINSGLKIFFNGKLFYSKRGLIDLLEDNISSKPLYPIIHFKGEDIEFALTHTNNYGEEYYSFVNGQRTIQGGTHVTAFNEALIKTIRDFYKKDFNASDIKASIAVALSVSIEEPVFESQTKTKLGSKNMSPNGPSIKNYIGNFVRKNLEDYLFKQPNTAEVLLKKILLSEKERKAITQIQKKSKELQKKVSLHNKKLRDCKIHYNTNHELRYETSIFITEGDSASGSITKARNVMTQAVFSLKGKPLNTFGERKEIIYKNEEFNLLQAALNIENSLDGLRYNKVIIATDADVDGMHIRLLLLTFFLQFYPELVKNGHLFILQTPLFRVRNKQETIYCYNEVEKQKALEKLGPKAETTRFKGLGEISPDEFRQFIGKKIRLEPITLKKEDNVENLLKFYMGKNTDKRQQFIINNLRTEEVL